MNRFMIKNIIKALRAGRKCKFKLVCTDGEIDYIFNVERDNDVYVTLINSKSNMEVSYSFSDVDLLPLPDKKFTITYMEESILTPTNDNYQVTKFYCKDLVQIFLPVFRILNEQVVFLLKTSTGLKQMYFIHGRVVFAEVFEGCLTLYQTDLRKIFNEFQNAEIVMFSRLLSRTSFKDIAVNCEERAKSLGLNYRQEKNGITIGGDIHVKAK